MGRLTLRVAVALITLAVGMACVSLYVTRRYRPASGAGYLHPASTLRRQSRPEGWLKIDIGGLKSSFYLPPDMKQQDVLWNGSGVASHRNGRTT